MLLKTRWIAFLFFFISIGMGTHASFASQPIRFQQIAQVQVPKVLIDSAIIRWGPLDVAVVYEQELFGIRRVVTISGYVIDPLYQVLYKGEPVKLYNTSNGNKFMFRVPLTGQTTSVDFSLKNISNGDVMPYPVEVIDDHQYGLTKDKGRVKYYTLVPSIGLSQISYADDVASLQELMLTAKVSYTYSFSKEWNIGANAFMTVAPLVQSDPALYADFLGVNARIGYTFLGIKHPWKFTIMAGIYFNAIFPSLVYFGYTPALWPHLYPTVRYSLGGGASLAAYFKYAPSPQKLSVFNTSERELAFGVSFEQAFLSGNSISVAIDISDLRFGILPASVMQMQSYSISAGFGF